MRALVGFAPNAPFASQWIRLILESKVRSDNRIHDKAVLADAGQEPAESCSIAPARRGVRPMRRIRVALNRAQGFHIANVIEHVAVEWSVGKEPGRHKGAVRS